MAKDIAKQISFSDSMWQVARIRLKQLGVDFPEYVRHLILNDTKHIRENSSYVTSDEEDQIASSVEDVNNNRYVNLDSDNEIDEFIDKL